MQYIPISELIKLATLEEINTASKEIEKLKTDDERRDFIEKNYKLWTNLKYSLWNLGNRKCWYSEDKLQATEGEVEHYRPKGDVCKSNHTGYWWLAFKWENLRFVHSTCNKRRTDYLTKKKAGKGTYFPLRNETARAFKPDEIDKEEPTLLDPVNPNDVKLICTNTSSGKPEPSPYCLEDEWKINRVKETIGYYHLDEGTWNNERYDRATAVNNLCKKIIKAENDKKFFIADNLFHQLKKEYLNDFAPFYSVAKQVVIENGLYDLLR